MSGHIVRGKPKGKGKAVARGANAANQTKREKDLGTPSEESENNPKNQGRGKAYTWPYPRPILRDDDLVLGFKNSNAGVIVGKNRHRELDTGYGGVNTPQGPVHHCSEVYIATGLGRAEREPNPQGVVAGMNLSTHINPKETDASFIQVSELCNIDEDLGLAYGSASTPARSAVAVSADQVRICADENIKLITKRKVYNSKGLPNKSTFGVDIIAGNVDKGRGALEPMVKGHRMAYALRALEQEVSDLNGVLAGVMMTLFHMYIGLLQHCHHSPFGGFMTTPPPRLAPVALTCIKETVYSFKDLIYNKVNLGRWSFFYTLPSGKGYICSKWNKVN